MVMVQMGVGVPYAQYTFIGAVVGALAHLLQDHWVRPAQVRDYERTYKKLLVGGYLDKQPAVQKHWWGRYPLLTAAFVFMMAAIVLIFELVFPWQQDAVGLPGVRLADTGLMNPTLAGVLVGLMQIPAFWILDGALGTSVGYTVIASQWVRVVPGQYEAAAKRRFRYAYAMVNSGAYWQVVYGLGAVLGGWLANSGVVVGPPNPTQPLGVGVPFGLVGGFLLMYGARLCGGCASGHGLSGMSLLSVNGWVTVAMMYAGAISSGFIMRAGMGDAYYGQP